MNTFRVVEVTLSSPNFHKEVGCRVMPVQSGTPINGAGECHIEHRVAGPFYVYLGVEWFDEGQDQKQLHDNCGSWFKIAKDRCENREAKG